MAIKDGWFTDRSPRLRGFGDGHGGDVASDTSLIIYGLWYLEGYTVQATICGIDCGDYTVGSQGEITVPLAADDQGILTAAYLLTQDGYTGESATQVQIFVDDAQHDITIPIVVGQAYTSRGQTLRPVLGQDLGIRVTHGMGKTRRAHEFAALFHYAVELTVGTDFDGTMDPVTLTTANGETAWPQNTVYTGVYRGILTDQYGYDSMLCWEVTRPWPAMVCAVSAFLVSEE